MCGTAAMYDAVAGKILAVGGAPRYQGVSATSAAHVITIGSPGSTPQVATLGNMNYARIFFHNSVILADGTVFITGGQSMRGAHSRHNVQSLPELWNPVTPAIYLTQPKLYTSCLSQLGIVVAGCQDMAEGVSAPPYAQIFTPSYLLNAVHE